MKSFPLLITHKKFQIFGLEKIIVPRRIHFSKQLSDYMQVNLF